MIFQLIIFIYIYINLSKCIKDGEYVEDIKKVEVRPLYKKDGRKEKSNYRPVSILSNVSKVHEVYQKFIESSNSEKLLGITIDNKLSFDDHLTIQILPIGVDVS